MKRGRKKTKTKKKNTVSKVTLKKKKAAAKQKTAAKKTKQWDPKEIRDKLKNRRNDLSGSEKKTIRLEWNTKSISEVDEKKVTQKVVTKGNYGPLDSRQKTDIQRFIKSTQMTFSQALHLRSAHLRQKAFNRHPFLLRQAKYVLEKYQTGHTVLDLAKEFDQPPTNMFRVILSEMKWGKKRIKDALHDSTKFKGRELTEYLALKPMDIVCSVDDKKHHEAAEKFEDIFSVWLTGKGIRCVRQEQLAKEQQKEFNKTVATPDFLLLDEVVINGTPCHWIDCKSYYGAHVYPDVRSTKKQMANYVDHWGPGAIIYLHGFGERLQTKIRDCAFLNAYGTIDTKLLRQVRDIY